MKAKLQVELAAKDEGAGWLRLYYRGDGIFWNVADVQAGWSAGRVRRAISDEKIDEMIDMAQDNPDDLIHQRSNLDLRKAWSRAA